MTRMIERWFPCTEVSEASDRGWGSGLSENALFVWFAARPIAQARAAVLTSLLPWPDDEKEQKRLQDLVRSAMTERYGAWDAVTEELRLTYETPPILLDPFSGRGTIPLEAARFGVASIGLDYAPMAVLGSTLLTDYPFRDWSSEPAIVSDRLPVSGARLINDVESVLDEVYRRARSSMGKFYPKTGGSLPWGYLWSVTLPCQECGYRFPLFGSSELRRPEVRPGRRGHALVRDPGQSFYIEPRSKGHFEVVVHDGPPRRPPTLVAGVKTDGSKTKGRAAMCPFCEHPHPLAVHQRLAGEEHLGRDYLLVVADLDPSVGKLYRAADQRERRAAGAAADALRSEAHFTRLLPAVPDERIPENNGATIRPELYGAATYGDLCVDRQTLMFVHTARAIMDLGDELLQRGASRDYVRCLTGYAASVLVKQIKYATRGAFLYVGRQCVADIYSNEGTINFSYDFFEAGIGEGPATWGSIARSEVAALRVVTDGRPGYPSEIRRGTATSLPDKDGSVSVVVTDPPYDAMVYYTDLSDVSYCWVKRALAKTWPEMAVTNDPRGLQEKALEIIVKEHGTAPGEHRDREHYDENIALAFEQMRRVVTSDGVVTIVFGHGEPEVWHRLLTAIHRAGLVLTSSWPARTEAGSHQNKANIETTLTMACRTAPASRPSGRAAVVETEVKASVASRMPEWSRYGLAPTDMLMASAGPAMEVVGKYSEIRNNKGQLVPADHYLIVARRAVQDAEAIEIDHHPLDSFDARTHFALWWARLYRKTVQAKSELRWETLASDIDVSRVRDLIPDARKGCRFISAKDFRGQVNEGSAVIDVALAMAREWQNGLDAVGAVLVDSGRDNNDSFLWAALSFLADRLPDGDPDALAWSSMLRSRKAVVSAARGASDVREQAKAPKARPATLFDNLEEDK